MSFWGRAWRELRRTKLEQQLAGELSAARMRIGELINAEPYKSGFDNGVTVTIQQLHLWLLESRENARARLAALPIDQSSHDFIRGKNFAEAWIAEAIEQLDQDLDRRCHEAVSARTPGE